MPRPIFATILLAFLAIAAHAAAPASAPTTASNSAPVTTKPLPPTLHPALFLVGDSIMNTGTGTGQTGPWGYGAELIPFFDPNKIHVYNEAKGGRSFRGYIEEGLWAGILARMEKGDWVLLQLETVAPLPVTYQPLRSTCSVCVVCERP